MMHILSSFIHRKGPVPPKQLLLSTLMGKMLDKMFLILLVYTSIIQSLKLLNIDLIKMYCSKTENSLALNL